MEEGSREKQPMETEEAPDNHAEFVSSDDEIDYSVKPEFYDPNIDDIDEKWAHKQRKGRSSDAILSCPACFTTLCLDCQRHEKYVTQYRAMFVRNCKVRTDQILRPAKRKGKKSKARSDSGKPEEEVFRPVCCSVCSTEVGVLDEEEVYHFFNVIPSNS
ncbi:E2F-associated phosphoprotein [Ananas comosus]|uniref:E2F-associated phosphoprotein n=1 Tax=Ananas comosus TaxID=4615 RepID=A0A199VCB7_ANACO|nr:E2F-associated phosphoprotein [Ananas comosus]OAY74663.1 E2F-associated phosphoprotein [Ananas comosus]